MLCIERGVAVAYLFTPPTRRQQNVVEGALMFPIEVSSTVWRDGDGNYHAQEVPYMGTIRGLDVVTNSGPVLVDDATAAELSAAIAAADADDLLSQATVTSV